MRNKIIMVVLSVALAVSLAIVGCAKPTPTPTPTPAPEQEVFEWRCSDFNAITSVPARSTRYFCALVNGLSEGRIRIKYYGMGVLGSIEEVFDAVSRGELEMGMVSAYTTFHPLMVLQGCPFAGSCPEAADKLFYDGALIDELMSDAWEAAGVRHLARMENGMMAYVNNKGPVVTPDDMAGMKVRVPPSEQYIRSFENMLPDAVGEVVAWTEVYTSLERGVIDGTSMYIGNYESDKFYEVAKYYTDINQMYNYNDLVMSPEAWNSLPQDLQDILTEAAGVAEDFCRFRYRKESIVIEERCKAKGCVFTHLTPEQRQVFIDNCRPFELYEELYGDVLEEYYPGENMCQQVIDALKAAG